MKPFQFVLKIVLKVLTNLNGIHGYLLMAKLTSWNYFCAVTTRLVSHCSKIGTTINASIMAT